MWLTDTRLEAVRAVDADLAGALLRFRNVIDDAMLAGGDSKADLKMHIKVKHAKCDHRLKCLCSSDPSNAVCLPCPGSDASDATFELHRDAACPEERDRWVAAWQRTLVSGLAHALFELLATRCPYSPSASFFISGGDQTAEQRARTEALYAEAQLEAKHESKETKSNFVNKHVEVLAKAEARELGRPGLLPAWRHGEGGSLSRQQLVRQEGMRTVLLAAVPQAQLSLPADCTRHKSPWYYGVASMLIKNENGASAYVMSAAARGASLKGVEGIGQLFGLRAGAELGLMHAVPRQPA